jgi:tetratricopeptide (TPR) repeat protein
LNEFLAEPNEKANRYQWTEAAQLCTERLSHIQSILTPVEAGFAFEFGANCYFKAAFQSESRPSFEERMKTSQDLYRGASENFQEAGKPALAGRALARRMFAAFWLETDPAKRQDILSKCIELSKGSLGILEKQGDGDFGGESHLDLLKFFREGCNLSTDWRLLKSQFEEALRFGRIVTAQFESRKDIEPLIESLSLVIWLEAVEAQAVLVPVEFEKLGVEARGHESRLLEIAQAFITSMSNCLAKEASGHVAFDLEGNPTRALALYKESAIIALQLKDSLLLGRLFWAIAQTEYWLGSGQEDISGRRTLLLEGCEFAERAIEALKIPAATTDLAVAHAAWADCLIELANLVETDPDRKKDNLRKAVEIASKGTKYEIGTWGWNRSAHAMAKAMYFLARMETPDRKTALLMNALTVRSQTVGVADKVLPLFWEPVHTRNYLALIESELASEEHDPVSRTKFLTDAVLHLQQCLELGAKWATNSGFQLRLAQFSETHGDVLFRLLRLQNASEHGEKAIKAYEQAIEYLTMSNRDVATGPVRWKIAQVYDRMGNFGRASALFKEAGEVYEKGAGTVPGSSSTFKELRAYMDSWANIELARLDHSKGEYESAARIYSDAARTLKDTKNWDHLSRLCSARSILENGERLSDEENHSGSIEAFKNADKEFQAAREEIENRLSQRPEDFQDLREWLKVADQRLEYCQARIDLEQAKAHDKQGDKNASAEKYRSAAELFRRLAKEISLEVDRAELVTFAQFCEAWSMMKEAELTLSSELYGKAADTFLAGRYMTTREDFQLLAFANSSICRALEAATRFRESRNLEMYSQVKRHLESAADYFHEAGFRKTEDWTRGTQRLFDALVYMSEAEMEKDHEKKTEFYQLAEKQLGLAAKLYGDAGFPGKKKEALEHLERTRTDKDALLAPLQALSQVPTASGVSLAYLTLPRGQASGVERFEEACVVGETIISRRELMAHSSFALELEVANVGKTPATLLKLQDPVPQGFEYDTEKNMFPMEDGFIDLRGRRLEHLKTFQVKLAMRSDGEGEFVVRPRLFYSDDGGNYRSFQLQPTTLTVLRSVSGTPSPLTGLTVPPKIAIPEGFRFETERARELFQCLIKDFLQDYMSRRLYLEKAGWRSLMDLVGEMKIPRSAVYGPQGRTGPVLAELERRGLVETRIFPKERGRGGAIKKVRVAYENEIVKRLVEEIVKTSG